MTYACPNGHRSTDPDACSECDMPMSDEVGLPRLPAAAPPARCPACGKAQPGGFAYCPHCGARQSTGPEPLAPPVAVADFEAVVSVDRAYYDETRATGGDERPPFPGYAPERTVRLDGAATEIGRVHDLRNPPRPLPPVNLAERPAADLGVSRLHAVLQRDGDDWTVTDLDSKNGTYVAGTRLEPGAPRAIGPDETVNLGFWTAIRLRRKPTEGSRP